MVSGGGAVVGIVDGKLGSPSGFTSPRPTERGRPRLRRKPYANSILRTKQAECWQEFVLAEEKALHQPLGGRGRREWSIRFSNPSPVRHHAQHHSANESP